MQIQDVDEKQVLGSALILLGLSLGAAAAVAGQIAAEHMAQTAAMCGPTAGHCVRCVAAVALLIAAIGTSGTGAWLLQPRRVLKPAR